MDLPAVGTSALGSEIGIEFAIGNWMPWKVQLSSQSQAKSVSELQFAYCSDIWGNSCGTNNGNILGYKILPFDVTQAYTYDVVNRPKMAVGSRRKIAPEAHWRTTKEQERNMRWLGLSQTKQSDIKSMKLNTRKIAIIGNAK